MNNGTLTLYHQVVEVTNAYLGPASRRFVSRHIHHHLGIEPENLQKKELVQLTNWLGGAMALLIEDSRVVQRYIDELNNLAR